MKDVTKTIRKRCEKCNKPFSTADESVSLCRECQAKADFETRRAADLDRKENAKKIAITKKCIDCGSEFTVTNGELDFLKNHGYGEPIRCPDCRALHREYVKKGMNNVGMETDCVDCGKHIKLRIVNSTGISRMDTLFPRAARIAVKSGAQNSRRSRTKRYRRNLTRNQSRRTKSSPLNPIMRRSPHRP